MSAFRSIEEFVKSLFVIYPTEGTSVFIEDYEHFRIPDDVVVVGMENGANFQRIRGRKYLFEDLKVLFCVPLSSINRFAYLVADDS